MCLRFLKEVLQGLGAHKGLYKGLRVKGLGLQAYRASGLWLRAYGLGPRVECLGSG